MSMMRLIHRIRSGLLRPMLAARHVSLVSPVKIERGVSFRAGVGHNSTPGRISCGGHGEFGHGAILHAYGGRIELGTNVFMGPYSVIYGHGDVTIGDHTLISMHCRILSSNHTVPPRDTTIRSQPDILLPTRIGRDVWLGAGVTVLGGVTIGDGCVVGAGAVVTHDLPPFSIAKGVPARVTGSRKQQPENSTEASPGMSAT